MKVLVDTSVWVGHFKQRDEHLVALLDAGRVVCHPQIVVEIACGTPPDRRAVITLLAQLDSPPVASTDEILALIDRRGLQGRGCGCVDLGLLASALIDGHTRIWTWDKRLDSVADELGVAYRPALTS